LKLYNVLISSFAKIMQKYAFKDFVNQSLYKTHLWETLTLRTRLRFYVYVYLFFYNFLGSGEYLHTTQTPITRYSG